MSQMPQMFKLAKLPKGRPGKSYLYVLDLNRELSLFLSYISHAPFFDYFVSSLIRRYHRSTDRKRATENFMKFSLVHSEDRIRFIYPSKIFDRVTCMKLLYNLHTGMHKYQEIKNKVLEDKQVSRDEYYFYNMFKRRWIVDDLFAAQVERSFDHVHDIVNYLYKSHKRYIVKNLIRHRRGVFNVKDFVSHAYDVSLNVVNVYDPGRSRVPFYKFLLPYLSGYKNELIQEETWGMDAGSLIHLDALVDSNILFETKDTHIRTSDDKDDVPDTDDLDIGEGVDVKKIKKKQKKGQSSAPSDKRTQVIPVKNNIWKNIESSLYYEKKQDDKLKLIDMAFQSLPKPLRQMSSLMFELVDPLFVGQELPLSFISKESVNEKVACNDLG